MQIEKVKRVFKYGVMELDDLCEDKTPDEVRVLWAQHAYGELMTAQVEGPVMVGNKAEYTFVRSTRDKG